MRVPRGQGTVGIVLTLSLALLLLGSPIAQAQVTRCVGAQVSPCQAANTYSTWRDAYEAANKGDTVILTKDVDERLRVGKRLIVKTHTGVVLTDANVDPSPTDYIVQVVSGGEGTDLRLKVKVTADKGVPRSAGGIFLEVDSDVLNGSGAEGPGKYLGIEAPTDNGIRLPPPNQSKVATIGIRVNRGTGSKTMRVLGLGSDPVRITGFGVGVFVDNPSFHVTSYVRAEHNWVGLLQRWGRGQNFYGTWINNDVAIEMQAVHHNDTNSHTLKCNGVAVKSSMADEENPVTRYKVNGPHLEYNWHVVDTRPCLGEIPDGVDPVLAAGQRGVDVQVQVGPDPRDIEADRRAEPGYYIQYGSRKVDGVMQQTYVSPGPS